MSNNQIVISRIQNRRGRRENLPQPLRPGEIALTSDTNQVWIGGDPALALPGLRVYSDKDIAVAQAIVNSNIVEARFNAGLTQAAFESVRQALITSSLVSLELEDILLDTTYRGAILSVTIENGGSGYTVGDSIVLSSATGTAADVQVFAVDGLGAITDIVVVNGGVNYRDTNTTATVVGTGSNAVLSVGTNDIMGYAVHIAANPDIDPNNNVSNILSEIAISPAADYYIEGSALGGTIDLGGFLSLDTTLESSNIASLINRVNATTPSETTGLVHVNLNIEIGTGGGGGGGGGSTIGEAPYEIGFHLTNAAIAAEPSGILTTYVFTRTIDFTDGTASRAYAAVAPIVQQIFVLNKNGVAVGSVTFEAAANIGTVSIPSPVSFVAGDRLDIVAPATADGDIEDVAFTLVSFITLPVNVISASTTVNTYKSISGDGSLVTPLQLVNDLTTPGNLKFYGTDGAGTRGWFDQTGIDHDTLTNFVAGEHVNHTSVSINTTSPLAGGGDISSTRTLSINTNGIGDTLLRQGSALSVIGRSANSLGNVADISTTAASGAVLRESGSTIGWGTIATAGIGNNQVTYAKIQQSSVGYTVLAKAGTGAGNFAELVAGADGVLRRSGSGDLAFGTLVTNNFGDNQVTLGKLAQIDTARFLGRVTAATGNVESLTGTQATTLLDTFTSTLKGLAPPSGGGTTTFLRADGTWATPVDTGEVNTASNVGATGVGVYKQKTGVDLEFKKLLAGTNIFLESTTDNVVINYASVLDYGAVADGTTNDAAAIQAAINAEDVVYFPAGDYRISSTLTLRPGVLLIGDGRTVSRILKDNFDGPAILGEDTNYVTITRLGIVGPGYAVGGANANKGILLNINVQEIIESITLRDIEVSDLNDIGIYIGAGAFIAWDNVRARNIGFAAFYVDGGDGHTFTACSTRYGLVGFFINKPAGFGPTTMTYTGCYAEQHGCGFYFNGAVAQTLSGCGVEAAINFDATWNGKSYWITGASRDIAVISCLARNDTIGAAITAPFVLIDGSSDKITINNFDRTLHATYTAPTWEIDYTAAGNEVTLGYNNFTPGTINPEPRPEYVSVIDYGAVGSGTVDDSTAIQDAIDADAGVVYFPKGTYRVDTGLTLPSGCRLVFATGAMLTAGTNSMTVISTTAGFKSGIKLYDPAIDGNGMTGVTAISLANTQFDSAIVGANINECTNGIILSSTCIGIHIDRPTIYGTLNPIQINSSNSNVVTCPQIDHQTGISPLTGTGIFMSGSSNLIQGGFIQGFESGVYDQGDYNKVDATYFELCTDCAVRWDGCQLPTITDVFFFGQNAAAEATYLIVSNDTDGGRVMWPKMVVGNSTGGVYYFLNGNTNCFTDYSTDGGTTNSALGTTTQIRKLSTTAFVDVEESLAATGTTSGTAAAITARFTEVSTSTAGVNDGVILPALVKGEEYTIFNKTANAINVYPPSGQQINYAGVDTPYSLPAYNTITFIAVKSNSYYT